MELRRTFDAESKSTWDVLTGDLDFIFHLTNVDYDWDEESYWTPF